MTPASIVVTLALTACQKPTVDTASERACPDHQYLDEDGSCVTPGDEGADDTEAPDDTPDDSDEPGDSSPPDSDSPDTDAPDTASSAPTDVPTSNATAESNTGSGGGMEDFGTPTSSVTLSGVPWISQIFTCESWDATRTCGPTVAGMAIAYTTGQSLDDALVQDLVEDLGQSWPCGDYTSTSTLAALMDGEGVTYEAQYFDADDVIEALSAGHPIIAPVYTQDTATGEMDLASGVGHFMLVVGASPDAIIANDPGRSSSADGSYHSFDKDDFVQAWWENGSLWGLEVIGAADAPTCTGSIDSVSEDGTDVTVALSVECTAEIDTWTLVVDEGAWEHSEEPSGDSDSFEDTFDLSAFDDGASHTLGLWAVAEGGTAALMDSATFSVDGCDDADGDGYDDDSCGGSDCDDSDSSVHPGATETCDGVDEDCDGTVDDGVTYATYYADDDGDGYGDEDDSGTYTCSPDSDWVTNDEDCDDGDSSVNPSATDDECDDIDNDCSGSAASPSSHDGYTCYADDIWYYDSCGDYEEVKESCEEGCSGSSCSDYAEDQTSYALSCHTDGSTYTDILVATASEVTDPTGTPQVEVTWEKCDGTSFSSTKTCNVRVGSYASSGVSRTSFTWSAGSSSQTTTFDGWPSTSPFSSASCGDEKEFYVTCDDSGVTAKWTSSDPVLVEKICP